MGYTRATQSVAANTTVSNVLSGKQMNMVVRPSLVRIGAVTSATGLNMTVQIGDRIVVNDEPLPVKASDPIEPDDFHFQFRARAGEYLNVSFRNSTAGALTLIYIIKVIP